MTAHIRVSVLVAALAACAAEEPPVGETGLAVLTFNGRYLNGRYLNGRYLNGRYLNGARIHALLDPDDPETLEYLVSCALPAGKTVEMDGESYAGAVGLAPEWAQGRCGEECERWISACLLARVNARGEHVEISMRGHHPALRPVRGELSEFRREEGTYYGNVFADPDAAWATSAREDLELPRTCGDSVDGCYVDVVGASGDVCQGSSAAQGRFGCENPDGVSWPQAITVYLR